MSEKFNSDLFRRIQEEGVNSTFLDKMLLTLLNTFPDHVYIKDTSSRFIRINESLANLFQLKSPEDAIGKTDFDYFAIEHAQNAFDEEKYMMKTGVGKNNFIEKETWPDGTISWVASTKVPFYDENGIIIGIFGISRDITERKKVEKELANRAKELQCFIDISKTAKRKDLSAEGYVHKINDLIPEYLSHASIICSRIVIGNRAIKSRKFKETDFIKKYKIFESDKIIGMLEIFFTEDFKKESCHFSEETDQVLKLIVDRISEIIEKKWIEKDLRKWEHFLKNASSNMDLYQ